MSTNLCGKKYNKLSIWVLIIAGLLLTVTILPQTLPTWEVNNPVSEVFVIDTIPPTTGSLAAGDSTVPDEYLSDPAIDSLVVLMQLGGTDLYDIVGRDDVVILKCSFQWEFRNNTNNDRIKGLVWKILNHPEGFTGEVLIGDNTQYRSLGSTHNNSDDTNQDILDVINTFRAKGYPVYKYEWMYINESEVSEYSAGDYEDGFIYNPITKVSYPKFQTEAGTYVSLKYGIWDSVSYNRDKLSIINFPVLKAHGPSWGGATEGLKNWMGMLSAAKKNERYGGDGPFHFDYIFNEYALVAKVMQITYPDLTIIDATWTNPERNNTSATVRTGKLLASTDPAAVSWYSTKFVLTPIAYYPESTDPDNEGGRYNRNINYWVNCLQDSGIICTIDSSKISVYNRGTISAGSTFPLTVSISDGWNMVSVPGVNPDGQGVANWWSGRIGDVFKFSGGYHIITTTTPGEGYWMKHLGSNIYNTGDEWPAGGIQIVSHQPLAGASGWNLIGGYELSVTAANASTNPPGLQSGPIYEYLGGYQIATTLDPGYSYWMKLTATGQIIIPETLAKDDKPVEYFPEIWGKILLTDAKGINYTLYAVKGEVDLNQYELPPVPPEGMFDIRFSTGRIAEDLNGAIKTIEMSGVTYPLTVGVENMNIRLQDETGSQFNSILKSGEDAVIRDATISKLMVTGELIPDEYSLEQNHPNPFNPTTTIRFSLPRESQIKINIYNMLGELVATLVEGTYEAGYHKVTFIASELSSGAYIYRLESSQYVQTRKMLLLK